MGPRHSPCDDENDCICCSATSVCVSVCVPCDTSRFVRSESCTAVTQLAALLLPSVSVGQVPRTPAWGEPPQVTRTGWGGSSRAGGWRGRRGRCRGLRRSRGRQRERGGVVAGQSQPGGLSCPSERGLLGTPPRAACQAVGKCGFLEELKIRRGSPCLPSRNPAPADSLSRPPSWGRQARSAPAPPQLGAEAPSPPADAGPPRSCLPPRWRPLTGARVPSPGLPEPLRIAGREPATEGSTQARGRRALAPSLGLHSRPWGPVGLPAAVPGTQLSARGRSWRAVLCDSVSAPAQQGLGCGSLKYGGQHCPPHAHAPNFPPVGAAQVCGHPGEGPAPPSQYIQAPAARRVGIPGGDQAPVGPASLSHARLARSPGLPGQWADPGGPPRDTLPSGVPV